MTAILGIFLRISKKARPKKTLNNEYIICYPALIKWSFMGLIIFACIGLTALIIIHPIQNDGDKIAIALMYGALLIFGAYFYIEFFTVKILVGENGITGTSGWRGRREYKWEDVEQITYSPASMLFKVTSLKQGIAPLRIHALNSGIDELQNLYTQKLPKEKWIKACEALRKDKRHSK